MNSTQIQKSEGSQTTKLIAPVDVKPGDVFTHFGVPLVSHSLAKAGEEAVFFKRATLSIPARFFGLAEAPELGPLHFSTVDLAREGWARFVAWTGEGDPVLGIVERVARGARGPQDVFVLSMADGSGVGGGSGGGNYDAQIEALQEADEAQTIAIDAEKDRNDGQDAEITAIEAAATSVTARVATLEDLVAGGGGGEGPDLSGIQGQIDDLDGQTAALAAADVAQRGRLDSIEAVDQVAILNVVQLSGDRTSFTNVTTIAPQQTKVLRLTRAAVAGQGVGNGAIAAGTPQPNFSPGEFVLIAGQLIGDRISFPRRGAYDILLQLAPQTDVAGDNAGQPYYAGNAMSVTIRKFDFLGNVIPNFVGKLDQAAGFWPSQRLQTTILVELEGESIEISVGNTNSGDAGDDQPVLLGPGAVVLANFRGRL